MSKQIQENKKCGKAAATNTQIYAKSVFSWVVTVLIFLLFAVPCETEEEPFRKRPGTTVGVLGSDVSFYWEYRAPVKVIVWYNGSVADPSIATYIRESDTFTAFDAWIKKLKFESSNSSDGYTVAKLTIRDLKPSDAGNYTAIFDAAGDTDDTVSLEVVEADDANLTIIDLKPSDAGNYTALFDAAGDTDGTVSLEVVEAADSENQFISTTAASNAMTTSPVPTTWISTLSPTGLFGALCSSLIVLGILVILYGYRWYREKREKPEKDPAYARVPASDPGAFEMAEQTDPTSADDTDEGQQADPLTKRVFTDSPENQDSGFVPSSQMMVANTAQ